MSTRWKILVVIWFCQFFSEAVHITKGPKSVKNYCNWNYLKENFIDKVDNYAQVCENTTEEFKLCRVPQGLTYWMFGSTQPRERKVNYTYGAYLFKSGEYCTHYYLRLERGNETIKGFFRDASKFVSNMSVGGAAFLQDDQPFTLENFDKAFTVSVYGFPGGIKIHSSIAHSPKNYCELEALLSVVQHWRATMPSNCGLYKYNRAIRLAQRFCKVTSMENKNIQNYLVGSTTGKCDIFMELPTEIFEKEPSYLKTAYWLPIPFFLVLLTIFVSILMYRKKIRVSSTGSQSSNVSLQRQDSFSDIGDLSVMILHRPGCDLLDSIVRDVSFIFHSYDIDVQTPLLEMNSIDAEGGIASYIQRNIHQCSYIVVLVTDPINDDHFKQKPFEFTMKVMSGLAFQQNQSSRYIPIYLKDFKQILPSIPLFLVAGQSSGYRVPHQIKELVAHLKRFDEILPKERINKLNFFVDRIKMQSSKFCKQKHDRCCKERCLRGQLTEDTSEFWSTSSVTTFRDNKPGRVCNLPPKQTNIEPPLTMERIEQWRNHQTSFVIGT